MRNQSPKVFPRLRQLTEDLTRNRYTAILDHRLRCDREDPRPDPGWEEILSGLSYLLLV
jgi:hypothetical protein